MFPEEVSKILAASCQTPFRPCLMDRRVKPFNMLCQFCRAPFDVIARIETLEEDLTFISKKLGLDIEFDGSENDLAVPAQCRALIEPMSDPPELKANPDFDYQTCPQPYKRIVDSFGLLTKDQLDSLYALYRHDFLMFGYDHRPYYHLVRPF